MSIDIFVSESIRLAGRKLAKPFDLMRLDELKQSHVTPKPTIVVGTARELAEIHPSIIKSFLETGIKVIVTEAVPGSPMPRFPKDTIHCTLPYIEKRDEWRILSAFLNTAIEYLSIKQEQEQTQKDLEDITKIGVLLSSEEDMDKLLELILTKSREITKCDAGSLYLVNEHEDEKQLLFKLAQNDSVPLNIKSMPVPLNDRSLAGYTIIHGQSLIIDNAYEIDPKMPYSHARGIDKMNNYRTISMLTVPLKNLKGDVVGALQLINKKRNSDVMLVDPLTAMVTVQPFDEHSVQLVSSLASLAAVTLEKSELYKSIQNLFEGFVKASVKAIESRDPTTSGHSERVSLLTVALAKAVDKVDFGPFEDATFTEEHYREIRYAGLLHDFGKVGVREQTLIKAKKLHPVQSKEIADRVMLLKVLFSLENWEKRFEYLMNNGKEKYLDKEESFELEKLKKLKELEEQYAIVLEANEPRLLAQEYPTELKKLAEKVYAIFDDEPMHLINEEEVKILSIPKGSLTDEERMEIESHVSHTYHFLRQIPWTRELRDVPEIAYKHHEKLNGMGYPRHLRHHSLPLQVRMMTICDIFDALTASDRPYKKAVPFKIAFKILHEESQMGQIDSTLLDIFMDQEVYKEVEIKTD